MAPKVPYKPAGFHTATPALVFDDAAKALEFYVKALGATEKTRAARPGGKIWHAEIVVGDSIIMVSDVFPGMGMRSAKSLGGAPVGMWLYVEDVDAAYRRAVGAGAKSVREPATEFWGDRMASVEDPFGHMWTMASHVEDVAPEEMEKRRVAAMAKAPSGHS